MIYKWELSLKRFESGRNIEHIDTIAQNFLQRTSMWL